MTIKKKFALLFLALITLISIFALSACVNGGGTVTDVSSASQNVTDFRSYCREYY